MISNTITIAIVEDDPVQVEAITRTLTELGNCHTFASADIFFNTLSSFTNIDVVVLDWGLPVISGVEVLKSLRNRGFNLPILFLTSRNSEADVVTALSLGADDYLTKPFRPGELLARVKNLLRRKPQLDNLPPTQADTPQSNNRSLLNALGVIIDRAQYAIIMPGLQAVTLTQREFDLALFLFENMNQPLSRDAIMEGVWRHSDTTNSRTLDTHISKVRSKLNLRPELGWRLTPVYSFGYRLDYQDPNVHDTTP